MSRRSTIIEIIYEMLESDGSLTLNGLKKAAVGRGLYIPPNSTIIRSTMYDVANKDSRIRKVSRGTYQLYPQYEIIEYIDDTEKKLTQIILDLKKFKWYSCTKEEYAAAEAQWERIKELYDKLGCMLTTTTSEKIG